MKPKEIASLILDFHDIVNGYVDGADEDDKWESLVTVREDIFSEIDKEFTKHFLTERWYTLVDRDRPWRVLLAEAEKAYVAGIETGDIRVDEYKHQSDILMAAIQLVPGSRKLKPDDLGWIKSVGYRLGFLLQSNYKPPEDLEALYDDFKALKTVFGHRGIHNFFCLAEGLKPWVQVKLYLAAIQVVQKIWIMIFDLKQKGFIGEKNTKTRNTRLAKRSKNKQEFLNFVKANRKQLQQWRGMKPWERARKIHEANSKIGGVDWIRSIWAELEAEGALTSESVT